MKLVSIIIPCFNEEDSLDQLFNKLNELEKKIKQKYKPFFIFVNDGSFDKTGQILNSKKNFLLNSLVLHHEKNLNLGAALKTGIKYTSESDYIVFLDSDCTYEPFLILDLLYYLDLGFDLATVSPYHPLGKVVGVPPWRLFLSRVLSVIYRMITFSGFYTFTAMVRAVRRDKIESIHSEANDFSYVAESFLKAIRKKYRIVEIPATLGVRRFGFSKMRLLNTIKSHLWLILNLIRRKI
jgi:dolichol-phosphate mannosyltransferase